VYQSSPRVFEALACGAFTISDNQRDVFKRFEDGLHLVKFHDSEDLIDKIEYYLGHPEEREYISKQGRKEVLANHTYEHRIDEMLGLIEK
jgi:spore maturation protein CgeB